jgi:hypothetical protein
MEVFEARSYIQTHDNRVKELDRFGLNRLKQEFQRTLHRLGETLVYGGPVSKDEFVNAILELEYPQISEARKIYSERYNGTWGE